MSEESRKIDYSSFSQIDLPRPEKERRKAIRIMDWNRCKKKIKDIQKSSKRLTQLYSTFLGLSFSSLINTIVVWESTGISSIIKAFYACVFIFSGILFAVFYKMDEAADKKTKSDCQSILDDMEEIESTFED